MNARLYRYLQRIACQRKTTFYGQVAPIVGLDMRIPDHRRRIGWKLDEISVSEREKHRPLLSVVVVRTDTKHPGIGFFEMARRLKAQGRMSDVAYFKGELERVWGYWSRRKRRA